MNKLTLTLAALMLFASSAAFAADAPATAAPAAPAATTPAGHHAPMTLAEARQKAHERADKLDKMTEAEWAVKQQKHHEWREHWKSMTPDEKKAWIEKKRAEKQAATPAATTPAPAPAQ